MTHDPHPPASTAPRTAPRRAFAVAGWAVLIVVAILVLAVAIAYLARRTLAREALVGWLEERGVHAEVEVERIDLYGFVGRIRAGSPQDPEFVVERAEVEYGLQGAWTGQALGAEIRSVRLVRPVLRARWRDGKVTLGPLDALVEELRRRPPRPDVRQPRVIVEDGLVRLDSPYGPVRARADARLEDGRLLRLESRLEPARLDGRGLKARVDGARLSLRTRGDRVDLAFSAEAPELAAGGWRGQGLKLRLDGQAPYPDLKRRRGDGALSLRLALDGADVSGGGARIGGLVASGRFDGRTTGWIDTLTVAGDARLEARAAEASGGGGAGRSLAANVVSQGLTWRRQGGDAIAAPLRADVKAGEVAASDAILRDLDGRYAGQAAWSPDDWRLALSGATTARGGWRGLGAPGRDDAVELAALKRSLADGRLAAPNVRLDAAPGGVAARLGRPVSFAAATGARAELAALGGRAVFDRGAGAFRLTARGGGLPTLEAEVRRYTLGDQGLRADLSASAAGSFGLVRDGSLKAAGTLSGDPDGLRLSVGGCVPVRAARLELGENDVADVSGEVCQQGGPLFSSSGGGWRLRGGFQGLAARAPFLLARVEQAAGRLDASGRGADLRLDATVRTARAIDEAPATRFNPVQGAGEVSLRREVWRGAFQVSDPAGRPLATADLRHDGRRAAGGMTFDTGVLQFAEAGLQPAALSPLASAIGSPATGEARFVGAFDWSPEAPSSHGRLTVTDLGFKSPAGVVSALSGAIDFTSLAPLATPPGQVLTAASVASIAPLTNATATFQIGDETLKLAQAGVEVGGGRVRLEPMTVPLAADAVMEGVMVVEGVQLSDIVERTPFADRVDLQAKVTGRLPFVVGPQGVRFVQGSLRATEPGRLSIRREALTQVGVVDAPVPAAPADQPADFNAVTDLAYQAMEDLAFESLDAEVNSLPGGRLGVLFKIVGQHSPPQKQRIRLGVMELLRRDFLKRKLPLPSGTKVNLTLDTSVNLDQLLQDFARSQRAGGSAGVQP